MGKADNQSLMEGIRGKVGRKAVFRRSYGETIVSVLPSKFIVTDEAQLARREKFREAIQYGKLQMAKPETKDLYKTGITDRKRSAYLVATSDFMKIPKITQFNTTAYTGAVGDQILIKATDDFKVTQVSVIIVSPTGQEIERGQATLSDTGVWVYVSTAVNATPIGSKVTATAIDLPGNLGTQTFTIPNVA
ncbi:MAG: hypothetical protein ABIS36_07340 [Chryseolinea sp.]